MKNATLIIAGLILSSSWALRAEGTSSKTSLVVAAAFPQPLITDLSNAPNPFDSRKDGLEGQTRISYELAQDAKVSIEIYSLLGMKVRGWDFPAGSNGGRLGLNTLFWDGTHAAGQKVAKGGYLAQIVIETPQTTVTAVRKIGVIH